MISIDAASSSIQKGETLEDTIRLAGPPPPPRRPHRRAVCLSCCVLVRRVCSLNSRLVVYILTRAGACVRVCAPYRVMQNYVDVCAMRHPTIGSVAKVCDWRLAVPLHATRCLVLTRCATSGRCGVSYPRSERG